MKDEEGEEGDGGGERGEGEGERREEMERGMIRYV